MNWRWRLIVFAHRMLVGQTEVDAARRALINKGTLIFDPAEAGDDVCLAMVCFKECAMLHGEVRTQLVRGDNVFISDARKNKTEPIIRIDEGRSTDQ